ncbi:MAG: PAS domain-containing protein, partial [Elainella sp.]
MQTRFLLATLKGAAAILDRFNHSVQSLLAQPLAQLEASNSSSVHLAPPADNLSCSGAFHLDATSLDLVQRLAHLGYWELELATRQMRWSAGMFALQGLEFGQIEPTYTAFQARVHPEDRQQLEDAITQAIVQGGSYAVAYRILGADGAVRSLLGKGEVINLRQSRRLEHMGAAQSGLPFIRQSQLVNSLILYLLLLNVPSYHR